MIYKENKTEEWILMVLALDKIRKQKQLTNLKIAELTGLKPPNVSRFFSCKVTPSLETFLKFVKAIGSINNRKKKQQDDKLTKSF